ncbi:MAG: TolC family protein, partial [Bdellovibrionales bacterium]|nr:TolC family protein [Bdellovibrionales bacterium]
MKSLMTVLVLTLLGNVIASPAQANTCSSPKTPNEFFWCLVNSHPRVQIQKADVIVHAKAIEEARQLPNPELAFEGIDNQDGGFTSEISLLQPIELGGKRSARSDVAKAQRRIAETRLLGEKERVARLVAIQLYRARQIYSEIDLVNENLETFRNIQLQYKKLGRLSPEQSVSSSVFEIAGQKMYLKKDTLEQELSRVEAAVQSILGKDAKLKISILPPLKKEWPDISTFSPSGALVQELQDEVSLANAQLNLAQSNSWPNLSIGPKIEHQSGGTSDTRFGFALSMPIPVLSL